jgi:L-serine dehydratase
MRFTAILDDGTEHDEVFYSVGGGFIVKEHETQAQSEHALPYPIDTAGELLGYCESNSCRISDIVMRNEIVWRSESEICEKLSAIRDAMIESIHRGCHREGVLPGGLNVQRRAARTARKLLGSACPTELEQWTAAIRNQPRDFQRVLDWVSCFALAVNEENAAFGHIVTAPTNGAAGVIPAVLFYCLCFCDVPAGAYVEFLLTAGEIGCIFKKGATISAALGGCQAEIGVSSAMAAAALTECLGGSPVQAAEAAEIAMEHHLGMTCDPIGGLVQIPCIERNAMGAVKAITAAQMALQRDKGEARVSLDAVINTMWETAQDMHDKYKETSEGGLAVQIAVNVSEC